MAIGPINYLQALPQEDFLRNIQGGLQLGSALRESRLQQQQKEFALQQQQQYLTDAQAALQNPNPQAFAALATKYPQHSTQLKGAWDMLSTEQQKNELRDSSTLASILQSNRHDLALDAVGKRIETMKAAGQPTQELEFLRDTIQTNPKQAYGAVLSTIAGIPGGDKILANLGAIGSEQRAAETQPFKTREAAASAAIKEAEAGIKGIEAANAPTATALSNLTAQEKIETARAEREIAKLDVQIRQANSETQRGELQLKRDELQAKLDEKRQTQGESAQDQLDTVRQSLTTVDTILKHPGATGFFYGPGTFGGKMSGYIPGTDRKDIDALVTTLKSQQFMTGIKQMQGMGALSNSEGDKIASAVASLDLDQTPGAFKNALGVIQRNLKQAEAKLLGGNKLPSSGGAFIMKHPTYGNVTEGQINRLMQQNPGSTREQVMQFLQSTGGK